LAAAAWIALVLASLRTIDPVVFADNPLAYASAPERIAKASAVLWHYLGLTLLPVGLKPDRAYADTDPTMAAGLVGLAAWIGVAIAAWMLRRKAPRAVFCVLWFPAAFAVTGNIAFPLGTLMAERLLYLPSIGPALLAGLAFERLASGGVVRRGAAVAVTAAAALVLAFAYDARGRVWVNDDHYHRVATLDAPKSAKAHYDRGLWLARRKEYEAAEAEFLRALAIVPGFSRAAYYLAGTYTRRDRKEDALNVYAKYLQFEPKDTGALSHLANLQLELGRFADAHATALRMVEIDPENPDHLQFLTLVEGRARLGANAKPQSLNASSSSGSR
jgi:tetratricopeptide (TPR) repeat protein